MTEQPDAPDEEVREHDVYDRATPAARSPLVRAEPLPETVPVARRRRRRILAVAASLALAVAFVTWVIAPGSGTPSGTVAPWSIELTTAGKDPVTALVFGKGAGWHLLRVPPASAGSSGARRVSARLGQGDLHVISLGWSSLSAHGSSPPGAPAMSWAATSHVFTAYQRERSAGVRALW